MKNKYRIESDVVYIELNRRKGSNLEAIIDLDDFNLVNSLDGTWCASEDKRCNITYCVISSKNINGTRTTLKLHKFITNTHHDPKIQVDHLNHNGLDNRRSCNLRIVTDAENKQNFITTRPNKEDQSLPIGVTYEKQKNSWIVRIYKENKNLYLHSFGSKEFAIEAYKYARAYYLPFSFEASEIDKDEALKILNKIEFDSELKPSRSNNKSGYRNVSWHKRQNKWSAAVTINKKTIHIGYFNDIEDAADAVKKFREKHGTSYWNKTVG